MAEFLTDEEARLVSDLETQLAMRNAANDDALRYYEGDHQPSHYGLSMPPSLKDLRIQLGWAGKVVDVNGSRLKFQGWATPGSEDPHGLAKVAAENHLEVIAHQAHLDALIFGCSFVVVGTGADGEPDPLITVHSPRTMTARYSHRTRRLVSAYSKVCDPVTGEEVATLYQPNVTTHMWRPEGSGRWYVERDVHNLGRVPVALIANRPRTERPFGRSEITKSIRSAQDRGVCVMANMVVNSEFLAAPQRFVLGADDKAFAGKSQWELIQGRLLGLRRNQDGELPEVGQFPQSSPEPYLAVLTQLARQVASDADLPVRYFDENRNAPTSADAIRADESALVARAERKQAEFSRGWLEVAELVLLVRDGAVPEGFSAVRPVWASAATPTKAASTDAVVKLVTAGILPPDSSVVLKMLDLSSFDREQAAKDAARLAEEKKRMAEEIASGQLSPAEQTARSQQLANGGEDPQNAEE